MIPNVDDIELVKVQFESKEKRGTFGGLEYTYIADIPLKEGEMVLAKTRHGASAAKVSQVHVPLKDISCRVGELLHITARLEDDAAFAGFEDAQEEQLEIIPADDPEDPVQEAPEHSEPIIYIKQLPVIEDRLKDMRDEVERITGEAKSLACSPETVQAVKTARTNLTRKFDELEDARKQVKATILAPLEKFEQTYKECITGPFKAADAELKAKISTVEQGIIDACTGDMVKHFAERAAAEHLNWLTWDRMNRRISLTEAKQKTHKRLLEEIDKFVSGVAEDVRGINSMDNAEEIMVEYQKSLNLANAVNIVTNRHQQIAQQQAQREAWQRSQAEEKAAAERVEAVIPAPAPVPRQEPAEPEKIYKLTFYLRGTKPQLIEFKKHLIKYCEKEGIKYE